MSIESSDQAFLIGLGKTAAIGDETEEPLGGTLRTDLPDLIGTIKAPLEKDHGAVTAQNLFQNPATHPLILHIYLTNRYESQWITWLSDSLWIVVGRDFRIPAATITKEKVDAVKTLLLVDSFWRDWEVFEKVVHAVNGSIPRFDFIQPPSLGQMMNAVHIARRIRKDVAFEEEVGRYISAIALEEGVEYLPAPLEFAQKFLGPVPDDVKSRYDEMLSKPVALNSLKETPADVQALKLLVGRSYAEYMDKQFKEQSKSVFK